MSIDDEIALRRKQRRHERLAFSIVIPLCVLMYAGALFLHCSEEARRARLPPCPYECLEQRE